MKEVKKLNLGDDAPANALLCVRNLIVWIGSFKNIYLYQNKVGYCRLTYVIISASTTETFCTNTNPHRTQPPHYSTVLR